MHFLKKSIECHFKRIFSLNKSSSSRIILKLDLKAQKLLNNCIFGYWKDYPKHISFFFSRDADGWHHSFLSLYLIQKYVLWYFLWRYHWEILWSTYMTSPALRTGSVWHLQLRPQTSFHLSGTWLVLIEKYNKQSHTTMVRKVIEAFSRKSDSVTQFWHNKKLFSTFEHH